MVVVGLSSKAEGPVSASGELVKPKRKGPLIPWRKPKDMPRRPLSAYNIFFREQREALMKLCVAEETAAAEAARTDPTTNVNTNTNVNGNNATGRKRKPRRSNKSVGIGFANLARSIAKDWKDLDDTTRAPYEAVAAREKNRYKAEMLLWRAKQQEQDQLLRLQQRQQPQPVPLTPLAAGGEADHTDHSRRMFESRSGSGSGSGDASDEGSPASIHTHSSRSGSRKDYHSNVNIQSQLGIDPHEEAATTIDRHDLQYSSFLYPFESNMAGASELLAQHPLSTDGMTHSQEAYRLANMMKVPDQRHQQQHQAQQQQQQQVYTDMMLPGKTSSSVALSIATNTNTTSRENLLVDERSSSSLAIEQQDRNRMLQQHQIIRQRQFLQQQHHLQYQQLLLDYRNGMAEQHYREQATSFGDKPHHTDLFDAHHPHHYQHQMPANVRRQSWSAGTTLKTPPSGTEARAASAGANRNPLVRNNIQGYQHHSLNLPAAWFETGQFEMGQLHPTSVNQGNVSKSFPADWFQIQDLDGLEDDQKRSSTTHISAGPPNLLFSHQGDIIGKLSATARGEAVHNVRSTMKEAAGTSKTTSSGSSSSERVPTPPFLTVLQTSAATAETSTMATETAHASFSVEPSSLETIKPDFDQDTIDFLDRVAKGSSYQN